MPFSFRVSLVRRARDTRPRTALSRISRVCPVFGLCRVHRSSLSLSFSLCVSLCPFHVGIISASRQEFRGPPGLHLAPLPPGRRPPLLCPPGAVVPDSPSDLGTDHVTKGLDLKCGVKGPGPQVWVSACPFDGRNAHPILTGPDGPLRCGWIAVPNLGIFFENSLASFDKNYF